MGGVKMMKLGSISSTNGAIRSTVAVFVLACLALANASCRANWTEWNTFCYRVYSNTKTWQSAETHCQQQGGYLASIHNDNEMNFVSSLINTDTVWIGLSDISTEMTFKWSDKSSFNFSFWGGNAPQNSDKENCAIAAKARKYQWFVTFCAAWFPYLCKYNASVNTAVLQEKDTCIQLYTSVPNRLLLNHILSIKRVSSILHCSSLCLRENNCKSFSFGETDILGKEHLCYMNSETDQDFPNDLVEKLNFVYAVPIK